MSLNLYDEKMSWNLGLDLRRVLMLLARIEYGSESDDARLHPERFQLEIVIKQVQQF